MNRNELEVKIKKKRCMNVIESDLKTVGLSELADKVEIKEHVGPS